MTVLSKRQYEVAKLIAEGFSRSQVSDILQISRNAVSTALHLACDRLGIFGCDRKSALKNKFAQSEIQCRNALGRPRLYQDVVKLMRNNPHLTQYEIAAQVGCCDRTVRNYKKRMRNSA